MICPHCLSTIPDGAQVCRYCTRNLPSPKRPGAFEQFLTAVGGAVFMAMFGTQVMRLIWELVVYFWRYF